MSSPLPSHEPTHNWGTGTARPSVVLLGAGDRPNVRDAAERLRPVIEQSAELRLVDLDYVHDLSRIESDLAVVLGGDGSILRASRHMGLRQRPIVGVNLGRLGFLADLLPDEFQSVWPEVCRGHCRVIEHMMFECSVWRDGQRLHSQLGLNETAIWGGPPYQVSDVDLCVDAELATTYSCDGLIISTPVGSTAHSLSAGGPILHKTLQAFVVLPINPHSLTVRPVVVGAESTFEAVVRNPGPATSVVVDGRVLCTLTSEDRMRVARAATSFQLVQVRGHSYYRTLREKLGWSGRLRT